MNCIELQVAVAVVKDAGAAVVESPVRMGAVRAHGTLILEKNSDSASQFFILPATYLFLPKVQTRSA